jgi:hypothetical protein
MVLAMAGMAWAQIPLIGKWQRADGRQISRLELRPDATGMLNGLPVQWTIRNGNELTLLGRDGTVRRATFLASQDRLALIAGGKRTEFVREPEAAGPKTPAPPCSTLAGTWRGPDGPVVFGENGSAAIGGVNYRYSADASAITLTGGAGVVHVPYQLAGGVLTMLMNGKPVMLACVTQQERAAALAGLAGRWRRVDAPAYFTFLPDGSYEFYSETSSGPSVTTERDSGSWTATATTLTMQSRETGAAKTYSLEKRNDSETKAQTIVLNGQPYVAYGPHAPW